ncbi:flagellar motor switch protein FliN [Gaopeijia maritima]|uniref:Flagellar motor switch protein FliN n=1 Tax=Gaopeijia maritima TaxID=3119007 RepID=A0ABU9EEY3_9BACT
MTTDSSHPTAAPAAQAAPAAGPGGAPAPAPAGGAVPASGSLEALYDLTLPVSIELGRTRMKVQEVLALGRGSVVQLERLVGEPVDVYVSDRHFAAGEVVVMGEQFGVRITRIFKSGVGDEA